MTETTVMFFEELGRRGRIPLLARANGTIRFELINGRHTQRWFISMRHGEVRVSAQDLEADCVVRVDHALFARIVSGETNALAAMLRGALFVEGDPELLVLVQRLFPGPPPRRPSAPPRSAATPAQTPAQAPDQKPEADAVREPVRVPAPRGADGNGGHE